MTRGFVSLVGAGPGHPDYLTMKGARRMREATLVLYDALISPEMLRLCPNAYRICVGKRSGRRSTSQETIHRVMVWAARRGHRVVRLKGGDPFVLGRGGEEALALRAAHVDFEVVPGVSSAIAAPALAGIPVTHRSVASNVVVISGHAAEAAERMLSQLAPGGVTVVVMMGLGRRETIAGALMLRGWSPQTPVAICGEMSHSNAWRWRGTLGQLASAAMPRDGEESFGTVVVGEVVALADLIGTGANSLEHSLEEQSGSNWSAYT